MASNVLTATQAEVWELRHEKKLSFQKIADRRGTRLSAAYNSYKQALKKLGPAAGEGPLELASPAERLALLTEALERVSADPSDAMTIRLAQDLRVRALRMADNQVLAQTSGPGLMQIASGATNIIQLLKGEPTAITRYEDMRKLDEFLEQVSAELKRRGDGPEVIDVTPDPEED